MDYIVEQAKQIVKRNNISRIGNSLGTILSLEPLKISISSGAVILDNSICYLCNSLSESNILKVDDKVLVISDATGTEFFIVDKVVV